MRRVPAYALAIAAGAAFTTANAQFTSANAVPSKTAVTTATSGIGGGFLMGADDCATPHTVVPAGDQFGVLFVTGTTGTSGQNEAACYAFGSTGVDSDVWFDWTSGAMGGLGNMSTCAGTGVDTKIAVWPGTAGCPADGTSLACNDDACGFQSTVGWTVAPSTTYTLQIGTFPGATGGSGTFDISVGVPPPCGVYDDGVSENALGLTAGGEMGWLQYQDCKSTIDAVQTAYGTAGGATPANGTASRIVAYEDTDCDANPTTGLTVMWSLTGAVANGTTDILENYPYPGSGTNTAATCCTWVMATADHAAMQFPGPMDQTNPTPNAWVVGNTAGPGSMDIAALNNNNVAPLQMQAIGFAASWLLRADGADCGPTGFPTTCFGDGPCSCGNSGDGAGGCNNSVAAGGAILAGSGNASLSGDTFVLSASRTTNQPGIFFQGNMELTSPPIFGDGLRCCGGGVVRIGTYSVSGNAVDTATGNLVGGVGPPISDVPLNSGLAPGDSRCYQWWYRDPPGPCGGQFNLSNAVLASWTM